MLSARSRSRSCSAGTRYSGMNHRAISARPSQCDDPHRPSSRRSTYRPLRFPGLELRIFLRQPLAHLLNNEESFENCAAPGVSEERQQFFEQRVGRFLGDEMTAFERVTAEVERPVLPDIEQWPSTKQPAARAP